MRFSRRAVSWPMRSAGPLSTNIFRLHLPFELVSSWPMSSLLIGVISDTHGLLRPEAVRALRGVDRILHAGDVGAPDILPELARIAPVSGIRGNVDFGDWADALPETLDLEIDGIAIHMLHDLNALALPRAAGSWPDLVIAGHSHRPVSEGQRDFWHLNPGSAGPRRFHLPVTLAHFRITNGHMTPPEIESLA